MSNLENSIKKCYLLCESDKITDKKKGIKELSDIVNNHEAVKFLNRSNSASNHVNWPALFNVAHNCLLSGAERWKKEEDQGNSSATVATTRENLKASFASVVESVLKKGNEFKINIKCDDILAACFRILDNRYLRKCFGARYLRILQDHVLRIRKCWTVIKQDQWKEIFLILEVLWKHGIPNEAWVKNCVIETFQLVVLHGCTQSHLGINVRRKLMPLLLDEWISAPSDAIQNALLSLTLTVSSAILKESRTGVCHLGEIILSQVCSMYDFRSDESTSRNSLVVDFLLLQIQCHHPGGSRYGSEGYYACDSGVWNRHLQAMYKIAMSVLNKSNRNVGSHTLKPAFLELSVELCNQLFVNSNSMQDVTLDDTMMGSALKKRKIAMGIQAVMDELHACRKDQSSWRWLSLVSALLHRYPKLFQKPDLHQLLEVLSEMQCTCKDAAIMSHIIRCCENLLKVMEDSGLHSDVWQKVWETTLRIVGLNQCPIDSHSLLRALIEKRKIATSGHMSLLKMFYSRMVQPSNHSLHSLALLLCHIQLPESKGDIETEFLPNPWEQPLCSVRLSLLSWLLHLSETSNTVSAIDMDLLTKLVVILTVRLKSEPPNQLITGKSSITTDFQREYLINAFEDCIVSTEQGSSSPTKVTSARSNAPTNLVDKIISKKLEEYLTEKGTSLEQSFTTISSKPPTQRSSEAEKLKAMSELSCEVASHASLLSGVLSYMVCSCVIDKSLEDNILCKTLGNMLRLLGQLLKEVLKPSIGANHGRIVADTETTIKILSEVSKLYSYPWCISVITSLRELTGSDIVVPVFGLLTAFPQTEREHEDTLDGMDDMPMGDQPPSLEDSGVVLLDENNLTINDKLHWLCLHILTMYSCPTNGQELSKKQQSILTRILQALANYDQSHLSTFFLEIQCLRIVLNYPSLDREKHLNLIFQLLQVVCRSWSHDAEAAAVIVSLLRDTVKQAAIYGETYERQCLAVLLSAFKKKTFGPAFTVELVQCYCEVLKYDKKFQWARWKCGTNLTEVVDQEDLPQDALMACKDQEGRTAIVEEIPIFLLSSFHEVRLITVQVVAQVFSQGSCNAQWENGFFARISVILNALFILKEGNLEAQERIDESSNRTATILHMLGCVVANSSQCYKKALFLIFRLIKEKNVKSVLVKKVFQLLPKAMNLENINTFLTNCLQHLLSSWLDCDFPFKDFPWIFFNVPSWEIFLKNHLSSVITVILYRKQNALIDEVSNALKLPKDVLFQRCFPSVLARLLPALASENTGDSFAAEYDSSKKQYGAIVEVIGIDCVKTLVSSEIDNILFELACITWDPNHCKGLMGPGIHLPQPDRPFHSQLEFLESLKYLKELGDMKTDRELIIFIGRSKPSALQKVLLRLRSKICAPVTADQRLLALHHYCVFSHAVAVHLQQKTLPNISEFLVRDISHTLLHLVKEFSADSEHYNIAVGACCYLRVLFEHIIPACVETVGHFLHTLVGILTPLAMSDGPLRRDSHALLNLLIVTHHGSLKETIAQLPPFPEETPFDDMRQVHSELKYGDVSFNLEAELKHFLGSVGSACALESLQFLRKQLSEKKNELHDLYKNLENVRGFSEDCASSLLHQLICTLINLASTENQKVKLEASRCLGELGAADLTTLVLKPAASSSELSGSCTNPLTIFLVWSVRLLTEYLVDKDVEVVAASCTALYSIMSVKDLYSLLDSRKNSSDVLQKGKLSPFLQEKYPKRCASLPGNAAELIGLLCQDDVWCPTQDISHDEWVKTLVRSLLCSFSDEDSCIRPLVTVCDVKTSFAEEILPALIYLGVNYSSNVCQTLSTHISKFFRNHSMYHSDFKNSQTSVSSKDTTNVYQNKASVQCMLNTVNLIRQFKIETKSENVVLDVNYLHVAQAALFCSAYFSSILFAELWADDVNRRSSDLTGGLSIAPVDYLYENNQEEGNLLQSLLREAYRQIGDHDAMYGCGSSMLSNPTTRVKLYEHMGMWEQALLSHDMTLSLTQSITPAHGICQALQRGGLFHLLNAFVNSLPPDQKESLQSAQIECMWRLGQWDTSVPAPTKEAESVWKQFSALKAVHDGDKISSILAVNEGRFSVLNGLTHESLESCNNIYKALSLLQAFQEMEDLITTNDLDKTMAKWAEHCSLPASHFHLLEPILAQRATMIESLPCGNVGSVNKASAVAMLSELRLATANLARKEGQTQIAELWLNSLSRMSGLSEECQWQLRLQEAQLAWSRGRGTVDADTNKIGCQQLRLLLKDLDSSQSASEKKLDLHAQALSLYGTWMAETHSENPIQIIEKYMLEALEVLKSSRTNHTDQTSLEAHQCLARYADLEYQRIAAYMKSESFESKQKCMDSLLSDVANLKKDKKDEDAQRAARIKMGHTRIDEQEISNVRHERDYFLDLAVQHYLQALDLGHGEILPVFRVVSIWLDNASNEHINKLVKKKLSSISSYKFVILLPQLAARIGDTLRDKGIFTSTINSLIMRCAQEHPHHTLPFILALANSYEDVGKRSEELKEARVLGATHMLSELRKVKSVSDIVVQMEKVASALISLAYLPVEKTGDIEVPKTEKVRQLHDLQAAMVPVITLPVRSDGKYESIVGIYKFEGTFSTAAGGIHKPKKIMCIGTDGVRRPTLVKGEDDLRQDAVMQQVFAIMNTLLQTCKETKRRKLLIRTYKIVPLTKKSGVLEWCQNTAPLGEIVLKAHAKHYPKDLKPKVCRDRIMDARDKSNAERLRVYKDICMNVHPVFRFFFTEKFPTPAVWFERRLAYIHSVATNSMVGYILGLGDRHVQNILVDQTTAELVHIDFGIAFEQGRILPTPETVPFRLTRDLEDGMGVSGIEGVFRRSCEKTMGVLRRNQETILTILEVLLYDPLYSWAVTPKTAASRQNKSVSRASVSSDSETEVKHSIGEVNKMAERALLRLQQKLQGTEEGSASSIEGQVNRLIQQARDPANLSRLFYGWQAYL